MRREGNANGCSCGYCFWITRCTLDVICNFLAHKSNKFFHLTPYRWNSGILLWGVGIDISILGVCLQGSIYWGRGGRFPPKHSSFPPKISAN